MVNWKAKHTCMGDTQVGSRMNVVTFDAMGCIAGKTWIPEDLTKSTSSADLSKVDMSSEP
jgi:hypothetical protein